MSVPMFFLTAAVFMFCFAKTWQSYLVTRKKSVISLLLLFSGCAFISICSGLDLFLIGVLYTIRYGYAFSLLANSVATASLLYFATNIFFSGSIQKFTQLVRLGYSIVFSAFCIWGTIDLLFVLGGVTSFPLILQFLLNLTLYIVLAAGAYSLAKRVNEPKYKTSITYIGHYALANLGMYVFFILDSLMVAVGQEGTSAWSFVGACVFALSAFLAYMGFVKPMRMQ